MKSFNGLKSLKDEAIAMAQHHYDLDMLAKGTFGRLNADTFEACSVGCMAHDIDPTSHEYHKVVAKKFGLTEWLIHMQDWLFENLEDNKAFHVEFYKRIPVGVDLQKVYHMTSSDRMQRLIVQQKKLPVAKYTKQVLDCLEQVKHLHDTESTDEKAWEYARDSAYSARIARSAYSASYSARIASYSARIARSASYNARSAITSALLELESLYKAFDYLELEK